MTARAFLCLNSWAEPTVFLILAVTLLGSGGCTREPMLPYTLDVPAQTLSLADSPTVTDGRNRFREIFCTLIQTSVPSETNVQACDRLLLRLKDESKSRKRPVTLPARQPSLKLVLVPGLFNDCVSQWVTFFDDAAEWLRGKGYEVDILHVNSRSSSVHNAIQIAEYIAAKDLPLEQRIVLIGHSKGVADILHTLVDFPASTARVAAVVSVAGAVNGSPLADWVTAGHAGWEALIPSDWCAPGDHQALHSLTRLKRLTWLSRNPLPDSVSYFSLVAFTDRNGVSWPLSYSHGRLSELDPRNDGLLLYYDQVIPGSDLLGYLHTDHWRVAYPVEKTLPFLSGESQPQEAFPRHLMLEAAVLYVTEALAKDRSDAGSSAVR